MHIVHMQQCSHPILEYGMTNAEVVLIFSNERFSNLGYA